MEAQTLISGRANAICQSLPRESYKLSFKAHGGEDNGT